MKQQPITLPHGDRWLTPEDLADQLRVPLGTVRRWRSAGKGPTGYRIAGGVRYRQSDVDLWIGEQNWSATA